MTNLENLDENQGIQTSPESLTDEQVQQVSFTDESREGGRNYETSREIDIDPTFKIGIDKIVEKEAASIINSFEKSYEESGGLPIEQWVRFIQNKHTDLIPFVCGDLGLPYKSDIYLHPEQGTKFSDLTLEQKMGFMCLKRTFDSYKGNIDNVSSEDFINKYYSIYTGTVEAISENFNNTIKKDAIELPTGFDFNTLTVNSAYYIKWSKFLKNNYGLTDEEINKFKDLKDILEKHPEYKNNPELMVQECGIQEVYGIAKIILALVAIGVLVLGYREFKGIFLKYFGKEETEMKSEGIVEIENFAEVFEIMALKAQIGTRDDNGNPGYVRYSEDAIKFKEGGGRLIRNGKKLIEKAINKFAGKSIDLKANLEVGFLFDAENAKAFAEKKKNGKGIIHIKIKHPRCEANVIDAYAKRNGGLVTVNLPKFDDFELRALDSLKSQALAQANTPENKKKAEESLRKSILKVFRSFGFAKHGIVIDGDDIEDVKIEYTDDEIQIPSNNTQNSGSQNNSSGRYNGGSGNTQVNGNEQNQSWTSIRM